MRIKHKYLRNKHYKEKHYKTIRNREHPFETYCSYLAFGGFHNTEDQINHSFYWIKMKARALESGHNGLFYHAPKSFRKGVADSGKRREERDFINKLMLGDFDALSPYYKKDANWLYW